MSDPFWDLFLSCIPVIPVVPAEVPIAPVDPLVAPEVGAVFVILPTGVLDLVDYSSSSDSEPSEDSLPVAPEKRVAPFPAYRLAWRRVPHRSLDRHSSLDFNSDSSSSSSSSDSLSDISSGSSSDSLSESSSVHSSRCNALGQSYSGPLERISKKRTKNEAKTTKPNTEWKSVEKTKSRQSPKCQKVNLLFQDRIGTADARTVSDIEVATSDIRKDEEEGDTPDLEGTLYDTSHYMCEVPLDRITEFETETVRRLLVDWSVLGLVERESGLGLIGLGRLLGRQKVLEEGFRALYMYSRGSLCVVVLS
ncbi:hypothetical protein Tco_0638209 [Tanacetum coccineum]